MMRMLLTLERIADYTSRAIPAHLRDWPVTGRR
jgi:hypothetical protein